MGCDQLKVVIAVLWSYRFPQWKMGGQKSNIQKQSMVGQEDG